MAKVAVVLSGCGVFDGAEIHESVLTLLALDKAGAEVQCYAPDIDQAHVINHLKGEVAESEKRNVLVESARIARGQIKNLAEANIVDFDALIFPGGFGAAKNLSSFAFDGVDLTVNADVQRIVEETQAAGKPIGFACISPVIAAKILQATVTIGSDEGTASAICSLGAKHEMKLVSDIQIDESAKVVTTPAYMCEASISEVSVGIEKMVNAVLDRVR